MQYNYKKAQIHNLVQNKINHLSGLYSIKISGKLILFS